MYYSFTYHIMLFIIYFPPSFLRLIIYHLLFGVFFCTDDIFYGSFPAELSSGVTQSFSRVSQFISQQSICGFPIASTSGHWFLCISMYRAAIQLALVGSSLFFSSILANTACALCVCACVFCRCSHIKHVALSWVHSQQQPC